MSTIPQTSMSTYMATPRLRMPAGTPGLSRTESVDGPRLDASIVSALECYRGIAGTGIAVSAVDKGVFPGARAWSPPV